MYIIFKKFVNYLSLFEDKKDTLILEELKTTTRPKTNINLALIELYANKYMLQNKNDSFFKVNFMLKKKHRKG